jgi:hypothetical protein
MHTFNGMTFSQKFVNITAVFAALTMMGTQALQYVHGICVPKTSLLGGKRDNMHENDTYRVVGKNTPR